MSKKRRIDTCILMPGSIETNVVLNNGDQINHSVLFYRDHKPVLMSRNSAPMLREIIKKQKHKK